jgi:hypothetical protein
MTETSVLALNTSATCGDSPPPPCPELPGDTSKTWDAAAHGFWFDYIDEEAAADFLDLTKRTLQGYRQRGGGARYYLFSARCLRYRRIDLRAWADARIRTSTSDPGQGAA